MLDGLRDIAAEPLGGGPGSAGPASFYNGAPRIAENYFIQVGQEVGVVGLGLFAAITVLIGQRLLRGRTVLLNQVLFASLVGLVAVNLLLHAWTDDTLAYIWWGLAGAAVAAIGSSSEVSIHKLTDLPRSAMRPKLPKRQVAHAKNR
jgi:hypothetical protein